MGKSHAFAVAFLVACGVASWTTPRAEAQWQAWLVRAATWAGQQIGEQLLGNVVQYAFDRATGRADSSELVRRIDALERQNPKFSAELGELRSRVNQYGQISKSDYQKLVADAVSKIDNHEQRISALEEGQARLTRDQEELRSRVSVLEADRYSPAYGMSSSRSVGSIPATPPRTHSGLPMDSQLPPRRRSTTTARRRQRWLLHIMTGRCRQ